MRNWLIVGLLLAGCGAGALLTGFFYLLQLRKIKTDLQRAAPSGLKDLSQASDAKDSESQRRSA
jgi:hypothetical protein